MQDLLVTGQESMKPVAKMDKKQKKSRPSGLNYHS